MIEHTNIKLARALLEADLPLEMVEAAKQGYYHDFLSPLAMPSVQLANDLEAIGTPGALAVLRRHMNGEFDATKEESDAWADSPEGREVMRGLINPTETEEP